MRISDWSSDGALPISRVGKVDTYAPLRQPQFVQLPGNDAREVRKSERRDVDIDAFFTDAAGVPGPVNELAIAICRDDDRATPRHERAAQVMQGSLSRSNIGVKSRRPYGSSDFLTAGIEIDRSEFLNHGETS